MKRKKPREIKQVILTYLEIFEKITEKPA